MTHRLGTWPTPVGKAGPKGQRFTYTWDCRCGDPGDGQSYLSEAAAMQAGRVHIRAARDA